VNIKILNTVQKLYHSNDLTILNVIWAPRISGSWDAIHTSLQLIVVHRIIVPNESGQLSVGPELKELKTYHRCPRE
jgi:hypothetical protein